jgi:hypothetical protein
MVGILLPAELENRQVQTNDPINFAMEFIKYNKRVQNAPKKCLTIYKNNRRLSTIVGSMGIVWLKQSKTSAGIVPVNMSASF